MSTIKMDLKKFKHVKSDKHSTTLQHADGHQLKIFHDALSPEAKTQLQALGTSSKDAQTTANTDELKHKGMAEGGGVEAMYADKLKQSPPQMPKKEPQPHKPPMVRQNDNSSRIDQGHGKVIRKMADGGNVAEDHECEGAKFCMHCGGAMMAEGGDPGQPEIPTDMTFAPSAQPQAAPQQPEQGGVWESIKAALPRHLKEDASTIANAVQKATGKLFDGAPPQGAAQGHSAPVTTLPPAYQPPAPAQGDKPQDMGDQFLQQHPEMAESQQPQQAAAPAAPQQQMQQQAPQQPHQQASQVAEGQPLSQDQAFEVHKATATDEHKQEDQAWAQDLANQHITPKTYQSLFADKGVPGKIGTIFGLLLGGMGGGLTGTPNAALAMMDKVIANDLDAQKKSKDNAQNFLRMTQQHEFQKAQQKYMGQQGQLTDAQAKQMKMHTDLMATDIARMKANRVAAEVARKAVEQAPPGSPQRAAAEQHYAMMANAINSENYNLSDRVGANEALLHFNMTGQTGNDPEAAFQQRIMQMEMTGNKAMADELRSTHLPGIPGRASAPIAEPVKKELQAMRLVDQKGKDILNLIESNPSWKNPSPALRAQMAQKVDEFKNFYNNSIQGGALTNGRLGWYDEQFSKNPSGIMGTILANPERFKEAIDSNAMRLDQQLSGPGGLGFPPGASRGMTSGIQRNHPAQKPQGNNGIPPGMKIVEHQGKQYLVPIQ